MAVSDTEKASIDCLVEGCNQLAVNLHKAFARNGKNAFFSPISVSSVLAMLLHGLRGDAESELRKCLGFENMENQAVANSFQSYISSLNNFPDGYTVSYANSVVIHKDFSVDEQYKSDLSNYFKALCMEADFVKESESAVEQINTWVKENTNNMIPHLLDSLEDLTVMVLLNAVYFKGLWLKQFKEKSTFMQYFYNDGKEDDAKLIEMMHLNESFMCVSKESYKVLQLPYKGEEMAMLVILPNSREGLHEIEDLLTPNFVSQIKNEMHKEKMEVALPKFRLEYTNDLKDTFRELGVKKIFQCGADYGGINNSKELYVSQIVHKAVLEVNEEGCEASAATAVVMMCRALVFHPEFIVDHPFAFMIYNTTNDLILFMGRVTEL